MMVIICGCDEAGRGPVLGPMVLAGVSISEDRRHELTEIGVKDSKLLTAKKRDQLYDQIIKIADNYSIVEVSPDEIDQCNADGINLNQLEAIKIAHILTELKPDRVYVDSPEPAKGGQKFGDMIVTHMHGKTPEIIAEHGADAKYEVASAASILAKVTRDNAVRCISKEIGHDIGSGYPADPKCKEFLEKHYKDKHVHHIRTCWSTYQKLKRTKAQTNLDSF
ncbi:ribonuclease HII [Candidatus Woesearchaeota archaeon]|nr:ribonuclease HII [Candidatus Woesearchaeota archaeon]